MKNKELKFKCGDIVVHKTSKLERFLIIGSGTLTDGEGNSDNIYLISWARMDNIVRSYITENEIELYNPKN
jgi:hypothetical protein